MIALPPDISISTNKERLDVSMIHTFLKQSYWAKGRTIETVEASIKNSFCFGVYHENQQIGFARVVSDCAIFAYIMDVFILESYRGQGLGLSLVNAILQDPQLNKVKKWMLGTQDAHALYQKVGFKPLESPEIFMTYIPS
ncbi:GNAT family N-acetyltransferase [Aureispira anguillae]|uniref:GNAT family N-acetyltransferase n=1 Tax=Aureispira anguillae TaxID=2864201 RepID=A0A915YKA2_9BACT|nr:GNAT family N-acetyltransferase [Aureispira anguillae]BDS14777.1 GNAT family N-acetyltransferase [Aureispira anguillae]